MGGSLRGLYVPARLQDFAVPNLTSETLETTNSTHRIRRQVTFSEAFKPVGWAKASLTRSGSTSVSGNRAKKGLCWKTPCAKPGC